MVPTKAKLLAQYYKVQEKYLEKIRVNNALCISLLLGEKLFI